MNKRLKICGSTLLFRLNEFISHNNHGTAFTQWMMRIVESVELDSVTTGLDFLGLP